MHILIIYFLWIEEILAAIMGACGNIGEVSSQTFGIGIPIDADSMEMDLMERRVNVICLYFPNRYIFYSRMIQLYHLKSKFL
jgi:hypothetical protein